MTRDEWTIQDYQVEVDAHVAHRGAGPLEMIAGEKREILTLVRRNQSATYEPDRLIGARVEVRATVDLMAQNPRPVPAKGEPL